jgi:hypothetical protein
MRNPFRSQFPWAKDIPEPEPPNDWYLDLRTGWHNRRDEQVEATRVATLERVAAEAEGDRQAGPIDGFRPGGPDYDQWYGRSNI